MYSRSNDFDSSKIIDENDDFIRGYYDGWGDTQGEIKKYFPKNQITILNQ